MNQAIEFLNAKIQEKAKYLHALEFAILEAERMNDKEKEDELDREFKYIETEHYALLETRHELEQIAGIVQVETPRVESFLGEGEAVA